jgi:hypothetical protein
LKIPGSVGLRVNVVHTEVEEGFIPNVLLMLKSGYKSGDYNSSMNYNYYTKWLKQKLIPNLLPKSILITDNTPYHNVQLNLAPTSSARKHSFIEWLSKNNISFERNMLTPELYLLIKLNNPRFQTFKQILYLQNMAILFSVSLLTTLT